MITPAPRRPKRIASIAAVVGVLALVAAAQWAGAGPQPPPAGLPAAGPATEWALLIARLIADLAAVALIGFLLLPAVLLAGGRHGFDDTGQRATRLAADAAVMLAVAQALQVFLGASTTVGKAVSDGLTAGDVGRFVTATAQGWVCVAQAVLAGCLAVAIRCAQTETAAWRALVAALPVVAAPALVGHASSSDQHVIAAMSLVAHILAALIWAGGLGALLWLCAREPDLVAAAASRFSRVALGCAAAVGASGLVAAVLHAGSTEVLFSSAYGALVAAKAALFAAVVGCGWAHRRATLPRLTGGGTIAFARLATVELLVMAALFGLAVALSRTPTTG